MIDKLKSEGDVWFKILMSVAPLIMGMGIAWGTLRTQVADNAQILDKVDDMVAMNKAVIQLNKEENIRRQEEIRALKEHEISSLKEEIKEAKARISYLERRLDRNTR